MGAGFTDQGTRLMPAFLKDFLSRPAVRALAALVIIVALGFVYSGDGAFYKWGTHRDMLRQVSTYGILACGMTIVIITGGIDLSVGSVLGLTAVMFSVLIVNKGVPAVVAVPACLLLGTGLGAVSGGLIAGFGLQPFIATLAMMVFARGLAKYASGGMKVAASVQDADGNFGVPRVFELLDARLFDGNITFVTIVLIVCVILCGVLLARTRQGRYLYAIGGNESAAHLSGLPVGRLKIAAYALSGFFAAVAGICQAGQEQQGDPEAGVAYELSAIAIVVIGGTSLMGGRGGMLLTLLGCLTIGYLEKILSINAVEESSRLMLTGLIIVTAVVMQRGRRA